jgi:hypothetical protein
VECEAWRSSQDVARQLGLSQPRVLEVRRDDQLRPNHLLVECTSVSGKNAFYGYINTLWMCPFYVTFCGQKKHALRVRMCSPYTTVTSGHWVILMLSANVDVKSASVSAFGLVMSETLPWAPDSYLTGWLLSDILLPELLEVVSLTVRKRTWFQHDAAPAHYGEDARQRITRHIQDRWTGCRGPIA